MATKRPNVNVRNSRRLAEARRLLLGLEIRIDKYGSVWWKHLNGAT